MKRKIEPDALTFCVSGKIKPYVRMTQGDQWKDQAQEYFASQAALGWQMREQMEGRAMLPGGTPLVLYLHLVETQVHNHDLDNTVKAVLDAAKGIAIQDDRWVDKITVSRVRGDTPRASIILDILRG